MNIEKAYDGICNDFQKLVSLVKSGEADKQTRNDRWRKILRQLTEIKEFASENLDYTFQKQYVEESVEYIREYMYRLIFCLFKDCHPELYPDWNRVPPEDTRWEKFYVPVCLNNGRLRIEYISAWLTKKTPR